MAVADAMVDDLVAFAQAWRPDVIVYDPLTYAAPIAAAVVGVPAVRHLFGPDQPPTAFEHAGLTPLLDRYGLDTVTLSARSPSTRARRACRCPGRSTGSTSGTSPTTGPVSCRP